jgi:hypothetical protein
MLRRRKIRRRLANNCGAEVLVEVKAAEQDFCHRVRSAM